MEAVVAKQIDWEAALQRIFVPTPGNRIAALTDEWYIARRGRITASVRAQIIASGRPSTWARLMDELSYELTDSWTRRADINVKALRWGREYEPEAIANAELELGAEVYEPGLVFHPEHIYAASTPDFFIGNDTTGQIKCPFDSENHLSFLYEKKLPTLYYYQINFEAWTSQRERIVFMSYDRRQPLATRCAFIELKANKDLWETFDERLAEFKELFEAGRKPARARLIGFNGIPEMF